MDLHMPYYLSLLNPCHGMSHIHSEVTHVGPRRANVKLRLIPIFLISLMNTLVLSFWILTISFLTYRRFLICETKRIY